MEILKSGGAGLDAIVSGIGVTESDNKWVGLGGFPNSEGVVQLDACIMTGPGHQAGSVAAVEGFKHPIAIARKVMESTPHVLLVGDGAMKFAEKHGFERGPKVTPERYADWKKWKAEQKAKEKGHDTIAMIALTADGHLFGGCSTSGLSYKPPGRVGDSPIIGSGLYVDDEVGGAGATGVGENVMRYCGSFQVVELMRQGLHPQEACMEVIRRIAKKDPKGNNLSIHFIALDRQGRYGGAGCNRGEDYIGTDKGFEYSVACNDFSKVLEGPWVFGT
jgi:isoaspartyl peptidase/L-asparaginase-like protein (Ntn-hydrolase superfamily)